MVLGVFASSLEDAGSKEDAEERRMSRTAEVIFMIDAVEEQNG